MARRRIHGPYRHGERWRLVLIGEDGTQVVESFGTQDEAEQEKLENSRAIETHQGLTVNSAIDAYETHQRSSGNKPRSIETSRQRVENFLADYLERPIRSITPSAGERAYEKLRAKVSVDTHRNTLNATRTFFKWCACKPRRWVARNPLAEIKGEGKRRKGKAQLRVDESRKFVDKARELAARNEVAGVVAMATLYFGTRITELISRQVRDLDDEGRLFWIPDSKTENGRRFLDVPEELSVHLLRLAKDRAPNDLLFEGVSRHAAYHMVHRVCSEAGVPLVGPHGLRGTHTSIARERGATSHIIAAAVGHGSYDAVTRQHYVTPGLEERVQQRATLGILQGGKK